MSMINFLNYNRESGVRKELNYRTGKMLVEGWWKISTEEISGYMFVWLMCEGKLYN